MILAGFVRGRLLDQWASIAPEERTLPERLSISMWTLDPRDGTYRRIASERDFETDELESMDARIHPDGFGHVDLAWRARRSLYVPNLLISTRSQGVLGSHDDGAAETFIAPVGDAPDDLRVVIYARLRWAREPAAERDPKQCGQMLTALDKVARIVRSPVQAVLRGLTSGDIRLDARGPGMAPAIVEPRTPEAILNRMAVHLVEGPLDHEHADIARAIGAVVGFRLSLAPSGPELCQQRPVVDEDHLAKLWTRLVQRHLFERADSRVGARVDRFVSDFERRRAGGLRQGLHESPGTGIVSDEIHPSLAIHEAFTTLYHVPVVDEHGALQAIFNLNVDGSSGLPQAWKDDIERGMDRLARLGDALRKLRPRGSLSCPFVMTDIAADLLRRITHELTRRKGNLERTLRGIRKHLRSLAERWGSPYDRRLRAAARCLRDGDLLQGLRTLQSVCGHGVLVSGWMPLYAFRLRRVSDADDIRVSTPEVPSFAPADPRTDLPARLFTQRREVAPLVRLMTSMAAQARSNGVRSWPIRPLHGARRDDPFHAIRVEDGTTHIFAPMGPHDPFPYKSCALLLGAEADATLVLSDLEAPQLDDDLDGVVKASKQGQAPPHHGHHLVTTWSRGHFDLVALSGVEGQLSAHQARAWRNAGGGRPRRLSESDMAIFEHARGVVLPLDRVRLAGRFSPAFEALLEHVAGTRSGTLEDAARECALDLLSDVPQEARPDAGSNGDDGIVARVAPFARLLVELGAGFRAPSPPRPGESPARAFRGFYGATSLARVVYVKPMANARDQPAGILVCLGTARRPRSERGPAQAPPAFGPASPERDLVDSVVMAYRAQFPSPAPWSALRCELEQAADPPANRPAESRAVLRARQRKAFSAVQGFSGGFTPRDESFPSEIRPIWAQLLKSAPPQKPDDWEGYLRFIVLMSCLLNAARNEEIQRQVLGIAWDAWRNRPQNNPFVTALKSIEPKVSFGGNIRFHGPSE